MKEIAAIFEVRTWNSRTQQLNYRTVTYTGNKSYSEYDQMIERRFPNSDIELIGGKYYYEMFEDYYEQK